MSFRNSDFGPLKIFAGAETVELRDALKASARLQKHHPLVRDRGYTYPASNASCPKMSAMYEVLGNGLKTAFGATKLDETRPYR